MVFYFTAKDGTLMYMGKDKYENEDLIKFGWPEDFWFHVDNLSSAHVYLRMPKAVGLDEIPEDIVRDAAQLVKENSIEGVKKTSLTVIYTPWSNLRKDGSMAVGQVSFHNEKLVRKYVVLERDKETLRRLVKTQTEKYSDLGAERAARDEEERARLKSAGKARAKEEKAVSDARKKEKEEASYDKLFKPKEKADPRDKRKKVPDLADEMGMAATNDATAASAYEDSFL